MSTFTRQWTAAPPSDAGLADALREAGSVEEAPTLYQATRKPDTDALQRISRESWDARMVSTAFPGKSTAK